MTYPQIKPRIWTDEKLYSIYYRLIKNHTAAQISKTATFLKENTPLFFHEGKLYNAKGEEISYQ
jgi:hypothetical protein